MLECTDQNLYIDRVQFHNFFHNKYYCFLDGDLEAMAKNIVKAMKEAGVNRIIAISTIGIYETPLRPPFNSL